MEDKENVALYWDFENIHISLFSLIYGADSSKEARNQPQPVTIELDRIMDFVAVLGEVNINKAYANWSYMHNYNPSLQKYAIDLIQLFPRGYHSKNGADIRMAIDVIEDLTLNPHISTVVIVGGDSDYIPVAQKVRQKGKQIVGIGVKETTNKFWIEACNQFRFYHTLLLTPTGAAPSSQVVPQTLKADPRAARALLLKAVATDAARRDDAWALKAALRPLMVRMDPAFYEADYGYKSFADFFDANHDALEVKKGSHDTIVRLKNQPSTAAAPEQHMPRTENPYELALQSLSIRLPKPQVLQKGIKLAFGVFKDAPEGVASFEEFADRLIERAKREGVEMKPQDATDIKNILYQSLIFRIKRDGPNPISLTPALKNADALANNVNQMLVRKIAETVHVDIYPNKLSQLLFGNDSNTKEIEQYLEFLSGQF